MKPAIPALLALALAATPALAQSVSRPGARPAPPKPADIWSGPVPSAWDAAAPRPGQPRRPPMRTAWRDDAEPGMPPAVAAGIGAAMIAVPYVALRVGMGGGRRGYRNCP